jgi:Tfp pilus assembly protein PilF
MTSVKWMSFVRAVSSVLILFLVSCGISPPLPPSVEEIRQAQALIDQGTVYLRRGALAEARGSFEVSYDTNISAAALDGLGCVSFLEGEVEQARDYFLAAYRYDPSYAQSLSNLALLYDFIGESEAALEVYSRALRVKSGGSLALRNNLGVLVGELGHSEQAKNELFRSYAMHPNPITAKNLRQVGAKVWQKRETR